MIIRLEPRGQEQITRYIDLTKIAALGIYKDGAIGVDFDSGGNIFVPATLQAQFLQKWDEYMGLRNQLFYNTCGRAASQL